MSDTLNLFVFVDALGWDIVQRYSFLDDLLPARAPLGTIFGYSSSCDPTFLTGRMPQEHGHFTFYYYDPEHSPFRYYRAFNLLPRWLTSRARVRHHISKNMKRVHGYTGYFQLYNMPFHLLRYFNYAEQRDLWRPGGVVGGQKIVFEILENAGTKVHLMDWNLSEATRIQALYHAIETERPDFAFLFLGSLDGVLHLDGTQSAAVAAKITEYETCLREVYARAQRHHERVTLTVFSDHGMTDVTETCALMATVEALNLTFGVDYAAAYDSTMARFWFFTDAARTAITRALEQEPRGRWLSKDELAAWGCDFHDHKYGELFFLLNPGVLLCPSHMGERPVAGMHGYQPDHPASVAAVLSNLSIPMPERLDGMFGLMLAAVDPGLASSNVTDVTA